VRALLAGSTSFTFRRLSSSHESTTFSPCCSSSSSALTLIPSRNHNFTNTLSFWLADDSRKTSLARSQPPRASQFWTPSARRDKPTAARYRSDSPKISCADSHSSFHEQRSCRFSSASVESGKRWRILSGIEGWRVSWAHLVR